MSPSWVIEAVDVMAKGQCGMGSCFITCSSNEFSFDGFEDGLDHGVIVAVALATHRGGEIVGL